MIKVILHFLPWSNATDWLPRRKREYETRLWCRFPKSTNILFYTTVSFAYSFSFIFFLLRCHLFLFFIVCLQIPSKSLCESTAKDTLPKIISLKYIVVFARFHYFSVLLIVEILWLMVILKCFSILYHPSFILGTRHCRFRIVYHEQASRPPPCNLMQ